jgi:hypothetical protein
MFAFLGIMSIKSLHDIRVMDPKNNAANNFTFVFFVFFVFLNFQL